MKKKMVVAWFVAVVAVMAVNEATLGEANVEYDYLKLAQHWPPTVCMTRKKCGTHPVEAFKIHGLWPDNRVGRTPLNCKTRPYETIVDRNLLENLNRMWINFLDGSAKNALLWKREWDKHGTCAIHEFNQIHYFEKATELYEKYDLISYLREHEIHPGDGLHQIADIKKAIEHITKKDLYVLCLGRGDEQFVYEIQICFNREGTEVIDCPANRGPQCTGEAHLPQAPAHQLLHLPA